jgi:hypothetical protein
MGVNMKIAGEIIEKSLVEAKQNTVNEDYKQFKEDRKAPIVGDSVNSPSHYNKGIETIDYIESWNMGFNDGNVVKYVTRAKYKGKELEDLKKCLWYIEREIKRVEGDK